MEATSLHDAEISNKESGNDMDRAQILTEEGKKAYALHEYETAIENFGEASSLIGAHCGEQSLQYAESLVLYGRALLENAITQSHVLRNDVFPKETEPPAEIDIGPPIEKQQRFHFEGEPYLDYDEDDEEVQEMEEDQPEGAVASSEERIDDLALAWESLDAARVIYSKIDTEEAKMCLGDLYITLGDLSLENESFDQAVNDFREGLKIKLEMLSEDDRQLAEAHYKLALGLELSTNEKDLAVDHVQKAIEVLQKHRIVLNTRLISLQEQESGKGKGVATTTYDVERTEKEIKDIDECLQEMEAKTDDLKTAKTIRELTNDSTALDDLLKSTLNRSGESSLSTGNVEKDPEKSTSSLVNDLTSLIKRKSS